MQWRELKIEGDLPFTQEVQKLMASPFSMDILACKLSNHVDGCVTYQGRVFSEGREVENVA